MVHVTGLDSALFVWSARMLGGGDIDLQGESGIRSGKQADRTVKNGTK